MQTTFYALTIRTRILNWKGYEPASLSPFQGHENSIYPRGARHLGCMRIRGGFHLVDIYLLGVGFYVACQLLALVVQKKFQVFMVPTPD